MAENQSYAVRSTLAGPLSGQFARFAVVGASNTVLAWCVFAACTSIGVWYPVAAGIAFAAGAVNGYTLNRVWTFRAGGFDPRGLGRYVVVQLMGMAMNMALVFTLVDGFAMHKLLAELVAIPLISLLSFGLSRNWAFAG